MVRECHEAKKRTKSNSPVERVRIKMETVSHKKLFLPLPIRQCRRDVARQVLRYQRQRLAFGTRFIATDADRGAPDELPVHKVPARHPVVGRYHRSEMNAIVARGEGIARLKCFAETLVANDGRRHHHIAVPMGVQMVGAVALDLFSQLMVQFFGDARLERFVARRVDLNRPRACLNSIARSQLVAGATREQKYCTDNCESAPHTHSAGRLRLFSSSMRTRAISA